MHIGKLPMKISLKDGLILHHHLADYGLFFEILIEDEYDLAMLPKNALVVDVGANIGLVSLIASKRYGAKVYSFEPCSNNYRFLLKNIKDNNCNNVTLTKKGVGKRKSTAKLYLHGSGTHSINEQRKANKFERINIVPLDKECASLKKINLLKIDVEGAELDVLLGSRKTLRKTKKIVMELTNLCPNDKVVALLENNGFEVSVKENILKANK